MQAKGMMKKMTVCGVLFPNLLLITTVRDVREHPGVSISQLLFELLRFRFFFNKYMRQIK